MSKYFEDQVYEVEASYLTDKKTLEILKSVKEITDFKVKQIKVLDIFDKSFDTDDFQLSRSNNYYRLRKQNEAYYVTFKHKLGVTEDAVHIVEEYEEPLLPDKIDDVYLFKLKMEPEEKLKQVIDVNKLKERFTIKNNRTAFVFENEQGDVIEADFDDITVTCDDLVYQEYELELEAKSITKDMYETFLKALLKIIPDLQQTALGKSKRLITRLGYLVETKKISFD